MPARRSAAAKRDMRSIAAYIANDNLTAAGTWMRSMDRIFDLLASQPLMSPTKRTHDLGEVRFHSHGNYVIYYRPTARGILVLHAARDHDKLL